MLAALMFSAIAAVGHGVMAGINYEVDRTYNEMTAGVTKNDHTADSHANNGSRTLSGHARAAASKNSSCRDMLKEWGHEQPTITYSSCKQQAEAPAEVLAARYTVAGKDAQAVHATLAKQFGNEAMRFICCYYHGGTGRYVDAQGRVYSILFNSDDASDSKEVASPNIEHYTFELIVKEWIVLP